MIGDMGVDPEAEPTMAALSDLVQKEQIDLIIHNGDIAYAGITLYDRFHHDDQTITSDDDRVHRSAR